MYNLLFLVLSSNRLNDHLAEFCYRAHISILWRRHEQQSNAHIHNEKWTQSLVLHLYGIHDSNGFEKRWGVRCHHPHHWRGRITSISMGWSHTNHEESLRNVTRGGPRKAYQEVLASHQYHDWGKYSNYLYQLKSWRHQQWCETRKRRGQTR